MRINVIFAYILSEHITLFRIY